MAYAFLSQTIGWADVDMERRYAYSRLLATRLADNRGAVLDLSDQLLLTHYNIEQEFTGGVDVDPEGDLGVAFPGGGYGPLTEDEQAALAEIIDKVNEVHGTNLGEAHQLMLLTELETLASDRDNQQMARSNPKDKVRLKFDRELWPAAKFDHLDMSSDFVKSLVDNPDVEKALGAALFEAFYREARRRAS